jgi:hypothetical protein
MGGMVQLNIRVPANTPSCSVRDGERVRVRVMVRGRGRFRFIGKR